MYIKIHTILKYSLFIVTMVFASLLVLSCSGLFADNIANYNPANQNGAAAGVAAADGKTVLFTGTISSPFSNGGAVPAEYAAQFSQIAAATDASGTEPVSVSTASRSAIPSKPTNYYYKVTASYSGLLIPIMETYSKDTTSFSLPLQSGKVWEVTVELKSGNILEILANDATILSDTSTLDLTSAGAASHSFLLKPSAGGSGSLSLSFSNPDSVFSSVTVVSVTKDGVDANSDWNDAVSCTTAGLSMITGKSLAAGVYDIKLDFKKGTKRIYTTMQAITVFPGLTTDTWVTSLATTDSDGKLKLRVTKQMADAFQFTDFFVGATSANAYPLDSYSGSPYYPLATVAKAVSIINDLPSKNDDDDPIQYTIHVKDGIEEEITSNIQIKNNISIECWKTRTGDKLGSATLKWTGASATTTGNYMIDIISGSLTLDGVKTGDDENPAWSGLVIDGNKYGTDNNQGTTDDNKMMQGIRCKSDCELHMKGGHIKNFAFNVAGAPVFYIYNKFIMDGGIISDNEIPANNVWSLLQIESCTFTMNDGLICDNDVTNSAYTSAATVRLSSSSNFTMNGGTITRNKVKCGGGVNIDESGAAFTMSGGVISNNEATSYGGGVYANLGSFIMTGGKITRNTAIRGGGVYVNYGNAFTISGSAYIPAGDGGGNKGQGKNDVSVDTANRKWFYIGGALTPPAAANGITATITPNDYTATNLANPVVKAAEGVSDAVFAAACSKFKVTPNGSNNYKINSSGLVISTGANSISGNTVSISDSSFDSLEFTAGGSYEFVVSENISDSDLSSLFKNIEKSNIGASTVDLSASSVTTMNAWLESKIESCTLPSGVTSLASQTFQNCGDLKEIVVSADNSSFTTVDGVLYNKDKTKLIRYPPSKEGSEFTLPDTVTSLAYGAFLSTKNLETINGLEQIQTLDSMVTFASMPKIKVLNLTGLTSSPPAYTFQNSSVEEVYLSSSVSSIGGNSFRGCSKLTKIHFATTTPPSLSIYNDVAEFSGCNSNLKFYVPSGSKSAYTGATGNGGFANTSYNALASSLSSIIIEE